MVDFVRAVHVVGLFASDHEIAVGRGGEFDPRADLLRIRLRLFGALGIEDAEVDFGRGVHFEGEGLHGVFQPFLRRELEMIEIVLLAEAGRDATGNG